MLFKSPTHRKFNYIPRFYNPENEEESPHPRIKFQRLTRTKPPQKRSVLLYLLIAIILIFIMLQMNKIVRYDYQSQKDTFKVEEFIIEE